jgi:hypothetical protein
MSTIDSAKLSESADVEAFKKARPLVSKESLAKMNNSGT